MKGKIIEEQGKRILNMSLKPLPGKQCIYTTLSGFITGAIALFIIIATLQV